MMHTKNVPIITEDDKQKGGTTLDCQDVKLRSVEVPMRILEYMKKTIDEEITQFRVGLVTCSGAATLGIERFITEVLPGSNYTDTLFVVCAVCFLFGLWHCRFGYKHNKGIGELIDIFSGK